MDNHQEDMIHGLSVERGVGEKEKREGEHAGTGSRAEFRGLPLTQI